MKKTRNLWNKRPDEEQNLNDFRQYLSQLIRLGITLRQDWFFRIVFGRVESISMLRGLMNGVWGNANEPLVDAIKIENPVSVHEKIARFQREPCSKKFRERLRLFFQRALEIRFGLSYT